MEVKTVPPILVDQALDRNVAACLKMFALLDGQLAIAGIAISLRSSSLNSERGTR